MPAGHPEAGVPTTPRTDAPLRLAPTAVTAFVGRTLKGPVNEPVRIAGFAQFVQVFGGLWQPSTLSYAVEQYFDNGGEEAVIVRVACGGSAPTLDLPAGDDWLALVGLAPGSREYLRASVDHDGIGPGEPQLFNLVVQRVRAPGSELVEAQEIFRRVSIADDGPRQVAAVLAGSKLVRVAGPVPRCRPDITPGRDAHRYVGYVDCNADGDDGEPLSDYDVIGSEVAGRGLFALSGSVFNFLYIPPLSRDRDPGMSTLLVAGRFCRRHHALLLVDPPADWSDTGAALSGLAQWPFHSADALMFFPRIEASDRLKGRPAVFAPGGAAAGLMARADRAGPHWWSTDAADLPLRPDLKSARFVGDVARAQLAARGVNVFSPARGAARTVPPAHTLGGGCGRHGQTRTLLARRLLLWIAASIEGGTRWVTLERNDARTRARARQQAQDFLDALAAQGAFLAAGLAGRLFVVCDERLNGDLALASGEFCLLYGLQPHGAPEPDAWLVTHRAGGSVTRNVTVNPYALGLPP